MAAGHRSIPPLRPQDILRFWEKVRVRGPDECWPWTAKRDRKGYGRFALGRTNFPAARVAWTIAHGLIPGDLCACHHCDNPTCQNPAHLFLGSYVDNIHDAVLKNRMACGERNGRHTHPERTARGERAARGARNGNAKLTAERIQDIRRRFQGGAVSMRALAREYSVTTTHISGIIHRKVWAHLGSP